MEKLQSLLNFLLTLHEFCRFLELSFWSFYFENLLPRRKLHQHDSQRPNVRFWGKSASLSVWYSKERFRGLKTESLALHIRVLEFEGVSKVKDSQLLVVWLSSFFVKHKSNIVIFYIAVHHS